MPQLLGLRAAKPVILALALLLVLAACGNGDTQPPEQDTATDTTEEAEAQEEEAEEGGEETGGGELTDFTLGTLPLIDVAPIHIALEDGLFEDEGLNVELELMAGGAAAIPGLLSGELDAAFGAWPSFFQAIIQGNELVAIADGVRAQPNFTGILTTPDTGLEGDPAGLEGATVAVNTLANLCELDVRSVMREAGADDDAVEMVEVPFPEMLPALERGDVAATCSVEPFVTIAERDLGAVFVADPYTGPMDAWPVAGYQMTAQFADENPDLVTAFQNAITEASEIAANDPDRVREIAPSYTELDPEIVEELTLPEFVGELDADELQRVADRSLEFGIIQEEVSAADYLAQ